MNIIKNLFRSGLFVLTFLALASIANADTYTVTTTAEGAGDGVCDATCTINEAVTLATNNAAGPNTIDFNTTGTITLTSTIDIANGSIDFGDLTIQGNDDVSITHPSNTVFNINPSFAANITIDGLIILDSGPAWSLMSGGQGAIDITGNIPEGSIITIQNNEFTNSACPGDTAHAYKAVYAHTGTTAYEVILDNNHFVGITAFTSEATNAEFTITDNIISDACVPTAIYLKASHGIILNNTITFDSSMSLENIVSAITYDNGYLEVPGPSEAGLVTISNNEIISEEDTYNSVGIGIRDLNRTLSFDITGNIIHPSSASYKMDWGILIDSGNDIDILNNQISVGDDENGGTGIALLGGPGDGTEINNVLIDHNTISSYESALTSGAGVMVGCLPSSVSVDGLTITNNIFLNAWHGIRIGDSEDSVFPISNVTNDYNITWYPYETHDEYSRGLSSFTDSITLGSHSTVNIDPALSDPGSYDLSLLPFSYAIGSDSENNDIGALDSGLVRRTEIFVDDNGEIDHETPESLVDYNDLRSAVHAAALTGDTIHVAEGTYSSSVMIYSKAVTINGAASTTTIIDGTDDEEGITFMDADNSSISNLGILNVGVPALSVSVHGYTYNSNTYNYITENNEPPEAPVTEGLFLVETNSEPADPENDFEYISAEEPLIEFCDTCDGNWHLVLSHAEDMYFTMYFASSEFQGQEAIEAWVASMEMTLDYTYLNAFTYDAEDDTFTFDSSFLGEITGVSLIDGSPTPTIDPVVFGSGIYFENSSNNQIENAHIGNNGYGITFTGDSLTNTVLNVIFNPANIICDVYSDATGSNSVNGEEIIEELCEIPAPDPEPEDVTDPVGLTALVFDSRTTSSVTLTWTPVVEGNFDHYEIWYGTDEAAVTARTASEWDNDNDAALATISTTSTTITGLSSATQYYFKIWAVDTSNNEETVATLSVTTSANSNNSSSKNTVITQQDTTPAVVDTNITAPITQIAETVVTVTETVKTETENKIIQEQLQQEAVTAVSNIIAQILTFDTVAEIVSAETSGDSSDSITSNPYSAEDLSVLTNPDTDLDGDGISNVQEIANGTDPLKNNNGTIENLFTTPVTGNGINSGVGELKILGIGKEGFVLSGASTPNSNIEISLTNSKGIKVTLKTTTDINGHYILPITLTDALIDGSLLIKASNENGQTDVALAKFKDSNLAKPTLSFEGENVIQYVELTLRELIALVSSSEGYQTDWIRGSNVYQLSSLLGSSIERKIAFVIEKADTKFLENGKIIVRGKATPGSTVVLAYKSVIYSSVVIADKNGNFSAELPEDLKAELAKDPTATEVLHEFIVFAMDYKNNETSNFNRGQFKLFK